MSDSVVATTVAAMAQFSSSTQKNFWHLSEAAVTERREKAHASAVSSATARTNAPPLSLVEELELLEHHERRVAHLSRKIGLPEKVASSAVVYLKRFFVDRSVMEHNPSVVALQAVYAASKVEEALISADDLVAQADLQLNGGKSDGKDGPSMDGTAARVRAEAVLNGELDFLQAIAFQLVVFHPYRSIRVVGERIAGVVEDEAQRKKVLNRANELCCTRALHSDIMFSLPPAVLASAAVVAAAREHVPDALQKALAAVAGASEVAQKKVSALADRVVALRKPLPEVAHLKELEAKRLAVRDELTDPTTAAFRKKEEAVADADDADRRDRIREANVERERRTAALLGLDPSPAEKRSREDAELGAGSQNSPVRKKLNLMG